jgi:hypothetical protein
MVATLSVAGCTVGLPITSSPTPTPTPTAAPTPPVDYSSYFDKAYEGGNSIMVQPFTKSTNERGNDVYKGVARNATLPGSSTVTMVIELTKSEAEAKQLHDSQVSGKLSEGYTPDATTAAKYHANYPDTVAVWVGTYGANVFVCYYQHDYTVNGWQSIQQSFSLAQ